MVASNQIGIISLCILIGLFGSLSVSNYIKTNIETFNPKPLLQNSNMIVIDNVSRGAFPRIFMHVPDQTLIFAASQSYLLNHKEEWLYQLNESNMYISHLALGAGSIGNSDEQRQKILDLIRQEYQIIHVERKILNVGEEVYTLGPSTTEELSDVVD